MDSAVMVMVTVYLLAEQQIPRERIHIVIKESLLLWTQMMVEVITVTQIHLLQIKKLLLQVIIATPYLALYQEASIVLVEAKRVPRI